jgi:hypothetical protein
VTVGYMPQDIGIADEVRTVSRGASTQRGMQLTAIDGLHQAEMSDLHELTERSARPRVAARERQERADELPRVRSRRRATATAQELL